MRSARAVPIQTRRKCAAAGTKREGGPGRARRKPRRPATGEKERLLSRAARLPSATGRCRQPFLRATGGRAAHDAGTAGGANAGRRCFPLPLRPTPSPAASGRSRRGCGPADRNDACRQALGTVSPILAGHGEHAVLVEWKRHQARVTRSPEQRPRPAPAPPSIRSLPRTRLRGGRRWRVPGPPGRSDACPQPGGAVSTIPARHSEHAVLVELQRH